MPWTLERTVKLKFNPTNQPKTGQDTEKKAFMQGSIHDSEHIAFSESGIEGYGTSYHTQYRLRV